MMRELPFELVVEILTRVPVKDLLRFRCVCKSWRSLFKEERFWRQHMTHAPTRIVSFGWEDTLHGRFSESEMKMILEEVKINVGDDIAWLTDATAVVGHAHGLLCLYFQGNVFGLWNPSLRELRTIHPPHLYTWYEMGFGYDPSSQDYKLVLVLKTQGEGSRSSQALVLSLKSGAYRMIDCLCLENFDMVHSTTAGTRVGQIIYWQVWGDNLKVTEKLLSFDLVSERFNLCPRPRPSNRGIGFPRLIAGLRGDGGLSTVGVDDMSSSGGLIVWSAQHDAAGRIKSWSKICSLSLAFLEISTGCPRIHNIFLASAMTYAGLLLALVKFGGEEKKLLSYNLEDKSLTVVETSVSLSICGFLRTYVETLFPVPIPDWNP